ncbi:MAG: T9SS type A sorting domain-containing protein [Putridiphycobacter sp.]
MKKLYFTFIGVLLTSLSMAQMTPPSYLNHINTPPNWDNNTSKAPGDSCGVYFNNYIGMAKTSIIRQEYFRTGNASENSYYNGRAQRFHAPQPIEVSGVEFYAYIYNNPTVDSLMVITSLNEYDATADSVGLELTRDTVYVTHHNFTASLPNMSTKSYFDTPILMSTDYVVSVFTPTDDSLLIIANDPFSNAGNGEGLSYALYNNPAYPSYTGWYSMLTDFGYDYDFLIAPLVKYKAHQNFTVVNDTICENQSNGCVNYSQEVIFTDYQYNSNAGNSTSSIYWTWGDNSFNLGLTSACHTYDNGGTYNINLNDTLHKWDYDNSTCVATMSNSIVVLDSAQADFTFVQTNTTVDFSTAVTLFDTLWWDFGDGQTEGMTTNPTHVYDSIQTYDVWLHIVNQCSEDSIMYQVTTDDVGLFELDQTDIAVFPNPVQSVLTVDYSDSQIQVKSIEIIGADGKVIEKIITTDTKSEIDVNHLSNGVYFIKIIGEKEIISRKFIKE